MNLRSRQIKFYTDLLKEDEILLLKSCDSFFKNHYSSSPLVLLTGFKGSEGEAIIDKNGKIKIFVDTRYHILVDKQVFDDVEIYKMELGETFFDAFKKSYKKNTVLHLPSDISLQTYLKYDEYFDLRKYKLKKSFQKNSDFRKNQLVFKVDENVEKLQFKDKVEKLKKTCSSVSKMIVFNLDEIAYLTNLRSYQMANSSNFKAILYLDFKSSNHILFCDNISKKIKIDKLNFMKLDEFSSFVNSSRPVDLM